MLFFGLVKADSGHYTIGVLKRAAASRIILSGLTPIAAGEIGMIFTNNSMLVDAIDGPQKTSWASGWPGRQEGWCCAERKNDRLIQSAQPATPTSNLDPNAVT